MAFIDPSHWGPSFWSCMHWTASGYSPAPTEEEKHHYKTFFENLKFTLPCLECREHYTQLLSEMPIDAHLTCNQTLRAWVLYIHNRVNENTEKGHVKWTLDDVSRVYPVAPETLELETEFPVHTEVPITTPIQLPPRPMKAPPRVAPPHPTRKLPVVVSRLPRINNQVKMTPLGVVHPSHAAPPVKKKGCGCKNKRK
jgi:hypothetical protein